MKKDKGESGACLQNLQFLATKKSSHVWIPAATGERGHPFWPKKDSWQHPVMMSLFRKWKSTLTLLITRNTSKQIWAGQHCMESIARTHSQVINRVSIGSSQCLSPSTSVLVVWHQCDPGSPPSYHKHLSQRLSGVSSCLWWLRLVEALKQIQPFPNFHQGGFIFPHLTFYSMCIFALLQGWAPY